MKLEMRNEKLKMKKGIQRIIVLLPVWLFTCVYVVAQNTPLATSHLPLAYEEVAPGVYKATIGAPEAYDLLKAAGAQPNANALNKLGKADFPFPKEEVVGVVQDGKTSLRFPLDREEQLYGFGLNFQTIHQRGKILQLHVDHYGGRDNGRTHAPVPFYTSSKGYGVFINSARYLTV